MTRGKMGTGSLLLAGLAAFAYYKYSKLSEEEKKNLVGSWKEKGQKLYDEYVPENIKSAIGKKSEPQSNGQHYATV